MEANDVYEPADAEEDWQLGTGVMFIKPGEKYSFEPVISADDVKQTLGWTLRGEHWIGDIEQMPFGLWLTHYPHRPIYVGDLTSKNKHHLDVMKEGKALSLTDKALTARLQRLKGQKFMAVVPKLVRAAECPAPFQP